MIAQRLVARNWENTEQREIESTLVHLSAKIENINTKIQSFQAYTDSSKDDGLDSEHFLLFGELMIGEDPGFINVSIAPNGVQEFIYPLEGNESVLGHSLLEDSRQEVIDDVNRAINENKMVISGPYPMRTDPTKNVIVFRLPVYFDNGDFYALVNMVYYTEEVLSALEYDNNILSVTHITDDGRTLFGTDDIDYDLSKDIEFGSRVLHIHYSFDDEYERVNNQTKIVLDVIFFFTVAVIIVTAYFNYKKTQKLSTQIDDLIYFDELTGLPNRRMLDFSFDKRKIGEYTIIFADLDNYKYLNDTFGHNAGDIVLKDLANQFMLILGPLNVYRWGGDEFVFIIESTEKNVIEEKLNKVLQMFTKPMSYNGSEFSIGISMGIYSDINDSTKLEDAIKLSDIAMYNVKIHGKNSFAFYEEKSSYEHLKEIRFDQLSKTMDFGRSATIHLQPRFSFETDEIVGFEALFRIKDDEGNIFLPGGFIQAAEKNGVIRKIDYFILDSIVDIISVFKGHGLNVPVAINVSGYSFDSKYVDYVEGIVNSGRIDPSDLEIEITESISLNKRTSINELFNRINEIGIGIMLDDFGSQYSSLSYLASLPVTSIKIDSSFVNKIHEKNTFRIIETIKDLSVSMKLDLIVEGVETLEQYDTLKKLGCSSYQGFLKEKAISVDNIIEKYGK